MKHPKAFSFSRLLLLLPVLFLGLRGIAFSEETVGISGNLFLSSEDLKKDLLFKEALQLRKKGGPLSRLESLKIRYLLEALKKSHFTFIRNGVSYNGKQAARHFEKKYLIHKWKVHSACEFIYSIASRSLVSGEVYRVEFPNGKVLPLEEILENELGKFEATLSDL